MTLVNRNPRVNRAESSLVMRPAWLVHHYSGTWGGANSHANTPQNATYVLLKTLNDDLDEPYLRLGGCLFEKAKLAFRVSARGPRTDDVQIMETISST